LTGLVAQNSYENMYDWFEGDNIESLLNTGLWEVGDSGSDGNFVYDDSLYYGGALNSVFQVASAAAGGFGQFVKTFNMRFPGTNNEKDVWRDAKVFEEISKFLPYAEPCFPILGESGMARYQSPEELAVISDTNYESEFETNNTEPPNSTTGSFGPSYFYETLSNSIQDAFANPLGNFSGNNNPYSLQHRPSKHSNKAKGVFGLPSIGSQVWVFFYRGDTNFPVYIGSRVDFRQTVLMTDSDNEDQQTLDYPGIFENLKKTDE